MLRILEGLCKQGQLDKALHVLLHMDLQGSAPSKNAYRCILKACTRRKALAQAKRVYDHLTKHGLESNSIIGEYLVSTLVKCGGLEDAIQVFCNLHLRTAISWTAIMSGYTISGQGHKALRMYKAMQEDSVQPDTYTFVCLVKACATIGDVVEGKRIHNEALKYGCQEDAFVGTALVDMYGKCGNTADARNVFDGLSNPDVVSWTAMLAAYVGQGQGEKALELYGLMLEAGRSPNNHTIVAVIQACTTLAEKEEDIFLDGEYVKIKSLEKGKLIHSFVKRKGYNSDLFVSSILVTLYGKCGSIVDARIVFDALAWGDVVSWNAMLAAYSERRHYEKTFELYRQMQESSLSPDVQTYVVVLQACGSFAEGEGDGLYSKADSLNMCKFVHACARNKGYDAHAFVGNTLISMYGKCGSIADAQNVFERLNQRDVVTWTAMIGACAQHLQAAKALQLYEEMLEEGVGQDIWTAINALQACGVLAETEEGVDVDGQCFKLQSLNMGKAIHAKACKEVDGSHAFIVSTLVSVYAKCGSMEDALTVFNGHFQRDVVAWTALLAAHVEHGQAEQALVLYEQMQNEGVSPNNRTFVSMLQACGMLAESERHGIVEQRCIEIEYLMTGKALHAHALRRGYDSDIFVGSTLIGMYQKCGSIVDAQNVFDRLSQQDVGPWNAIIGAYVEYGQPEKALQLYEQFWEEGMTPDVRTITTALQACGMLADNEHIGDETSKKLQYLKVGKVMHADAFRRGYDLDMFVGSTLVSLYSKCGSIEDARGVFDRLSLRDVVSWNAMLTAFTNQNQVDNALQLYEEMQQEGVSPDDRTFVSTLQACSITAEYEEDVVLDGQSIKVKALRMGKAIHAEVLKRGYSSDVFIGSILLKMYGKCGSIVDACNIFHDLPDCNVVSWTTMLQAYVEQGQGSLALELYTQKLQKGSTPDEITLVCILQACSDTGSLVLLRQLHESLIATGKPLSPFLASSLIHAYGKCSSMVEAQSVFEAVSRPDVVTWNALIAGYARQGNSAASLHFFEEMQLANVKANAITFLSLLSACSHAGWVGKGVEYFESMTKDHGITPDVGHYVSMVDLLGRAGCFRSVEDLLSTMPTQAHLPIWLCLLGACRKHHEVVLGEKAFDCAVRIQPKHAAAYKLMSNIYAEAGLADSAEKVKGLCGQAAAWNQSGQSWIEHGHQIHSFVVGDQKHPQQDQLYDLIEDVYLELEELNAHRAVCIRIISGVSAPPLFTDLSKRSADLGQLSGC